jgi:hypothetical protein
MTWVIRSKALYMKKPWLKIKKIKIKKYNKNNKCYNCNKKNQKTTTNNKFES